MARFPRRRLAEEGDPRESEHVTGSRTGVRRPVGGRPVGSKTGSALRTSRPPLARRALAPDTAPPVGSGLPDLPCHTAGVVSISGCELAGQWVCEPPFHGLGRWAVTEDESGPPVHLPGDITEVAGGVDAQVAPCTAGLCRRPPPRECRTRSTPLPRLMPCTSDRSWRSPPATSCPTPSPAGLPSRDARKCASQSASACRSGLKPSERGAGRRRAHTVVSGSVKARRPRQPPAPRHRGTLPPGGPPILHRAPAPCCENAPGKRSAICPERVGTLDEATRTSRNPLAAPRPPRSPSRPRAAHGRLRS